MGIVIDEYLRRLEIGVVEAPSANFLRKLHERHLLLIPFENLDIADGVEIVLDEDHILEKIVHRRRGGFCYELNAAFAWLVRRLGFGVDLLAARVARDDGTYSDLETDHLCLRVTAEKTWLCDVGFGHAFLHPLEMTSGTEQSDAGERHRLDAEGGLWTYASYSRESMGYIPRYRFDEHARQLAEFEEGCRFHQTSPDSHFTRNIVCSAALPDGRVTMTADRLILTRRGRKEESVLDTPEAWNAALERYFRIKRDSPAAIRPRIALA